MSDLTGMIDPDTPFSPEVYFSADAENGHVEITLLPLEDGLLKAELVVKGSPEWLVLNISLGTGSFQSGDTFGIIVDTGGTDPIPLRPVIRSSREGGDPLDTPLSQEIVFGGATGKTTLLHSITSEDPMAYGEAFHTLMLPLPKRTLSLTLHDMALIHLDAARSTDLNTPTLGGIAV